MTSTKRNTRRGLLAAVAVAAAGLALAGCGASSTDTASTPTTFTMSGTMTLDTSQSLATRTTRFKCGGSGGYSDLAVGAQVVVYGPKDETVAVGSVVDAISHPADRTLDLSEKAGGPVTINADTCELLWTVSDVPAGLGMYSYQISHRGKLVVTEADAKSTQTAMI